MDSREIKRQLNHLYGKSSFVSSEDVKEYGDLMQEVLAKRYASTAIVKPINFLNLLTLKNNYDKIIYIERRCKICEKW